MSTHYSNPRVYTNCHAIQCLEQAGIKLSISDFKVISENDFEPLFTVPVNAEIIWNSHKIKFMGELVDTCSESVVNYYFADGLGYLYELNTIEDYGDEGDVYLQGYILSEEDLFKKYSYVFDVININMKG